VLDEVDAALDATNVVRVATYMRHMTRAETEGHFQARRCRLLRAESGRGLLIGLCLSVCGHGSNGRELSKIGLQQSLAACRVSGCWAHSTAVVRARRCK
jgi:hypothetical protein